jgi:hypothetical protein
MCLLHDCCVVFDDYDYLYDMNYLIIILKNKELIFYNSNFFQI